MSVISRNISQFSSFEDLRFSKAKSWRIDHKLNLYFTGHHVIEQMKAILNNILRKLGLVSFNLTQNSINDLLYRLAQFPGECSEEDQINIIKLLVSCYKFADKSQIEAIDHCVEKYYTQWAKANIEESEISFTNSRNGAISVIAVKRQIELDVMRTLADTTLFFVDDQNQDEVVTIDDFKNAAIRKQLVDTSIEGNDIKILAVAICIIQNICKSSNYRICASWMACPLSMEAIQQNEQSEYKVSQLGNVVTIVHDLKFKEYNMVTKFSLCVNKLFELQALLAKINQLKSSEALISLKFLNDIFIKKELVKISGVDIFVKELQQAQEYYKELGVIA